MRFSGGAQAAHTVQIDGKRTVFHHYGSGTAIGAPTFLGKEFIINPILFHKERKTLDTGSVQCHVESRVTTPYDMIHNTLLETSRRGNKHGSCGIGINATVDRHEVVPFHACHLTHPKKVKEILADTYSYYKELHKGTELAGLNALDDLRTKADDMFIQDCLQFNNRVDLEYENYLKYNDIIFEGAQGLLLDEHHEWFPHVTRARTGLDNVIKMLADLPHIVEVDVVYVTRSYMTRHGAGPFPTEDTHMSFKDETNVHNEWQGALRFGILDLDLMLESIQNDFSKTTNSNVKFNKTLCITCLDQTPNVTVKYKGMEKTLRSNDFIQFVSIIWPGNLMTSHGPERINIKTYEK